MKNYIVYREKEKRKYINGGMRLIHRETHLDDINNNCKQNTIWLRLIKKDN